MACTEEPVDMLSLEQTRSTSLSQCTVTESKAGKSLLELEWNFCIPSLQLNYSLFYANNGLQQWFEEQTNEREPMLWGIMQKCKSVCSIIWTSWLLFFLNDLSGPLAAHKTSSQSSYVCSWNLLEQRWRWIFRNTAASMIHGETVYIPPRRSSLGPFWWSLNILPLSVWVFSECSGFLPQSKTC